MRVLYVFFLLGSFLTVTTTEVLETIAQWPLLDFALPHDRAFLNQYIAENVVPTGVEVGWHRLFINTPRLRDGVPATLSYIPRNIPVGSSPQLQAYPSWDWHVAGKGDYNCSRMISTYRARFDRCNRLWVLDSGIITSIDYFRVACPPKLLVFDTQTDQLVRQMEFPREVLRPNTLLTNLVIDDASAKTCDDVFVYMTDTAGPGILVFDGATDRSWRVVDSTMFPNPDYSTYRIGNDMFELLDGVIGLALSPRLGTIYYQPVATDRIFSLPTSALQAGPPEFGERLPVTLVGRKSSPGLALGIDPRDDTLIFAPFTETAIAAWQPQSNRQRILAYSPEELQFAAEIRWAERDNGNVWVLSTRFQKFFQKTINTRDINIRLMRIKPVEQVLKPSVHHSFGNPQFPLNFYNNTLGF